MKESVRLYANELWKRAYTAKPSSLMRVILDTNVVMDCLVFQDQKVQPILEAIHDARLKPVIHFETFAELVDVLGRSMFKLTSDQVEEKALQWLALCEHFEDALPETPYCKDSEDDKFFQLALVSHCPTLVTKDKLVLKARKRAKRDGISVMTIDDFVSKELPNV